jgi:hypothetical protein
MKMDDFSVEEDLPSIRGEEPGENFHEGALSCSVLTEQSVEGP